MRICRTSEQAPCQVGMEEAHCSRPSSFNVGVKHSLGSGEDENAGIVKRPLSQICQMLAHNLPLEEIWTSVRRDICLYL